MYPILFLGQDFFGYSEGFSSSGDYFFRSGKHVIHILLGFTKKINQELKLDYLHILGFSQKGQQYLKKLRKQVNIPLKPITTSPIYEFEKRAAFFYELLTNSAVQIFEKSNKPIIKKEN